MCSTTHATRDLAEELVDGDDGDERARPEREQPADPLRVLRELVVAVDRRHVVREQEDDHQLRDRRGTVVTGEGELCEGGAPEWSAARFESLAMLEAPAADHWPCVLETMLTTNSIVATSKTMALQHESQNTILKAQLASKTAGEMQSQVAR